MALLALLKIQKNKYSIIDYTLFFPTTPAFFGSAALIGIYSVDAVSSFFRI